MTRSDVIDQLLSLSSMSLALGEEERVTLHPDGARPETVATHSHMLGMVACAVATEANRRVAYPCTQLVFNVGLVAQFTIVHDVPEVAPGGPGDVDTFSTTDPDVLAAKDAAEDAAIAQLGVDHPAWLGPLIARYRAQKEREAQLVRYLDKCLPKFTLVLSGAAQFERDGHSRDYFEAFVAKQGAELRELYPAIADLVGPIYEAGDDAVRVAMDTLRPRK